MPESTFDFVDVVRKRNAGIFSQETQNPAANETPAAESTFDFVEAVRKRNAGIFSQENDSGSENKPKPPKPRGMVAETVSALASGVVGTGEAVAGTAEMIGLPGAGTARDYLQNLQESEVLKRPDYLTEGTVWEHHERLGDWRWWVRSVGENLPNMAAMMLPGYGVMRAARAADWGVKAIRAASLAGSWAGSMTVEAGSAYTQAKQEMTQDGAYDADTIERIATVEGLAAGTVNSLLELLPFDNLFLKQAGADRLIKRFVRQAFLEGSTESAQEAVNVLVEKLGHKPEQELTDNIGRILESGIIGGALGGIAGGTIGTSVHKAQVKQYNDLADQLAVKDMVFALKDEGISDEDISLRLDTRINEIRTKLEETPPGADVITGGTEVKDIAQQTIIPEVNAKEMVSYLLYGDGKYTPPPGIFGKTETRAKEKDAPTPAVKTQTDPGSGALLSGPAAGKDIALEEPLAQTIDQVRSAENRKKGENLFDLSLSDLNDENQQALEEARKAKIARRDAEEQAAASEDMQARKIQIDQAMANRDTLRSQLAGDDPAKQKIFDETFSLSEKRLVTAIAASPADTQSPGLGLIITPDDRGLYQLNGQPVDLDAMRPLLIKARIDSIDAKREQDIRDRESNILREERNRKLRAVTYARKTLSFWPAQRPSDQDIAVLQEEASQGRLPEDEKKVLEIILQTPAVAKTIPQSLQILGIKSKKTPVTDEGIISEEENKDHVSPEIATEIDMQHRYLLSLMESQLQNAGTAGLVVRPDDTFQRVTAGVDWLTDVNKQGMSLSKDDALTVIKKAQTGAGMTEKQKEVYDAIVAAASERIPGRVLEEPFWAEKGFYPVRDKQIAVKDLLEGDRFVIAGEEFTVTDIDDQGNVTLKDGTIRKVKDGTIIRGVDYLNQTEEATEFSPGSSVPETAAEQEKQDQIQAPEETAKEVTATEEAKPGPKTGDVLTDDEFDALAREALAEMEKKTVDQAGPELEINITKQTSGVWKDGYQATVKAGPHEGVVGFGHTPDDARYEAERSVKDRIAKGIENLPKKTAPNRGVTTATGMKPVTAAVAKKEPAETKASESLKEKAEGAAFQKEDRVVLKSGRHGTISKVDTIVMQTMFGGSRTVDHYYMVKMDSGVELSASEKDITREVGPAPTAIPDINVDGGFKEPSHVLYTVTYSKQRARESDAAAQRARKPENIRDARSRAESARQKAVLYQEAFDAWAAKYPEEAKKYLPEKRAQSQGVAIATAQRPPAMAATVTGAQSLADLGLVVTKGATNTGKTVWNVSGNTKAHSETIKRAGGRWYGPKKVWSFYNGDPTAQLQEALGIKKDMIKPAASLGKAASEVAKGVASSYDAIAEIMKRAGKGPISMMGGGVFDEELYQAIKPHLQATYVHFRAAAIEVKEWMKETVSQFTARGFEAQAIIPYIKRFYMEVTENDLTKGAAAVTLHTKEGEAGHEEGKGISRGESPSGTLAVLAGTPGLDAGELSRTGETTLPVGETEGVSGQKSSSRLQNDLQPSRQGEEPGRGRRSGEPVHPVAAGRPGVPGQPAGAAAGETGKGNSEVGGQPARRSRQPNGDLGVNTRIEPADVLFHSGKVARINANIRAIELSKKLVTEKRAATPAEQKILLQYSGWGAVAQDVFNPEFATYIQHHDENPEHWRYRNPASYFNTAEAEKYEAWEAKYGRKLHPLLGGILTAEEWKSAEASTLNAHYTSREVIEHGLWGSGRRLGFEGGRVLEPAAGIGHILGLIPADFAGRVQLQGVELDRMSGQILSQLYPQADIQITGFEKAQGIPDNSVDLVISNFPFGNYPITDTAHPAYSGWSIHNYFFARSVDALRPGGVVIAITSRYTMDSTKNGKARELLADKADLVGAIRLPNNAFGKNAGTDVTTDIIILRKKTAEAYRDRNAWRTTAPVKTMDGTDVSINEYFAQHPEMVLGKHSMAGTMYGGKEEYTLAPDDSRPLTEQIDEAVVRLPQGIFTAENATEPAAIQRAEAGTKAGTFVLKDGTLSYVNNSGVMVAPEWAAERKKVLQAASFISVRDMAGKLIMTMQQEDATTEDIAELQRKLNRDYDRYRQKYGAFNEKPSTFLADDVEFPLVLALENIVKKPVTYVVGKGKNKGETRTRNQDIFTKADIFTKRTLFPFSEPVTSENIEDAVNVSLTYKNHISPDYIAALLGKDTVAVQAELIEKELAFLNPANGLLESRSEYLSGNVREKLRIAEEQGAKKNAAALRAVQPPELTIDEIYFRLGSEWIPEAVIDGFMAEKMEGRATATLATVKVGEDEVSRWTVNDAGNWNRNSPNYTVWGSEGRSGTQLVEDCLNLHRTEIYDLIDEKRVKNQAKSLNAQQKQREIQTAFKEYVLEHTSHASAVAAVYNREKNNYVVRQYDVPGIDHYPHASHLITLRAHQKGAVSRGLQGSTVFAHAVGTGKTYMYATLAMELRRTGQAHKPLIVVQGSTVNQFAGQAKNLYPAARILCPSKNDRAKSARRALLARIATNDYDMIIIPHSFFDDLNVNPEREAAFIEEQLEEIKAAILELGGDIDKPKRGDAPTVKQLHAMLKRKEARLEALKDSAHGIDTIYFDEMGIDAVLVDEAHHYKRGDFSTKMGNVKGLDRGAAAKSFRFLMKARAVQEKTRGKNIYLATGTPVSNTTAELWTLLRYVRPDLLAEFGAGHFDGFASMFGDTTRTLEMTETGEFKDIERFNKYVNGPELIKMWQTAADVILQEDVPGWTNMIPKLKGDGIQSVAIPRSQELADEIERIRQERAEWNNLSGMEKKELSHVPLLLFNRAKQAAIDLRLVHADAADNPDSKTNRVVQEVFNRWEESQEVPGTQLVFADTYRGPNGFSLYDDIKKKLVGMGVPETQIANITENKYNTDATKESLFEKINAGAIRVVIGSTSKLGIGVNVQERLVAIHHVDAPMRPMDFEQRNGRILRPGNTNQEVEVLAYAVINTLDSVTYDRLQKKQKFINQLLRGKLEGRSFDDPADELQFTFEDLMAASAGNPLVKKRFELENQIREIAILADGHRRTIGQLRSQLSQSEGQLARAKANITKAEKEKQDVEKTYPDNQYTFTVDAKSYDDTKEGKKALQAALGKAEERVEKSYAQLISDLQKREANPTNEDRLSRSLRKDKDWTIPDGWTKQITDIEARITAQINGKNLTITIKAEQTLPAGQVKRTQQIKDHRFVYSYQLDPREVQFTNTFGDEKTRIETLAAQDTLHGGLDGILTSLRHILKGIVERPAEIASSIEKQEKNLAIMKAEVKKPFQFTDTLAGLKEQYSQILAELGATKATPVGDEAAGTIENPLDDEHEILGGTEKGLQIHERGVQYSHENIIKEQLSLFGDIPAAGRENRHDDGSGTGAIRRGPRPEVVSVLQGYYKGGRRAETAADIARIGQINLVKYPNEHFLAVVTDTNDNIINIIAHTIGTKVASMAGTGELAGQVLNTPAAKNIWLLHQHPSGNAALSPEDTAVFNALDNALRGTSRVARDMIAVAHGFYSAHVNGETAAPITPGDQKIGKLKKVAREFKTISNSAVKFLRPEDVMAYSAITMPDGGIILVDTKNTPVATYEGADYNNLRGKTQSDILKEAEKRNATGMFVVSPNRAVNLKNIIRFSKALQLDLLDVIDITGSEVEHRGAFEWGETIKKETTDFLARSAASVRVDTPISVEDAGDVIGDFREMSKLGSLVTLKLADSFDALPEEVRTAAEDAGGTKDNTYAVLHKDGSIYLIRDAHATREQLEKSIFHEVYGHLGIFKLFGKGSIQQLAKLYTRLGGYQGLAKIADKYGIRADFDAYWKDAKTETTPEMRNARIAAELLALIGQKSPTLIQRAKEALGSIRQALRRLGFAKLGQYGDSDLAYLLAEGKKALHKAGPSGEFTLLMKAGDMAEKAMEETIVKPATKAAKRGLELMGARSPATGGAIKAFAKHWKEFWQPFSTVSDGDKILAKRYGAMGNVARATRFIEELHKKVDAYPDQVKKDMFWYLNGDIPIETLPEEVRETAAMIRRRTEVIGEMLVDREIIAEGQFEKYRGKYIHYMYAKHVMGEDAPIFLTSTGKLNLSYTKSRNTKLTMQQKKELGLIEDASVAVPVGMGKALTDIAKYDYLQSIAENADWVWQPSLITVPVGKPLKAPIRGRTRRNVTMGIGKLVEEAKTYDAMLAKHQTPEVAEIHRILHEALDKAEAESENMPGDFVQLPNSKGYGPLAGAFVQAAIADDLMPVLDMATNRGRLMDTILEIERQGMAIFKMGKVALNIPTAVRNIVSNIIQNNMRGRPLAKIPGDIIRACESMKAKDEHYEEAFGMGLFHTNWFVSEINNVLDEFRKVKGGRIDQILIAVKNVAKYYGKIDDINKLAIFIERREAGTSIDEATLEAMKWGMDYSLTSRSIKGLRQTIMPFATYQYKIAPLIFESLKKRPWVLAKFALIYPATKALAMGFNDLDDDDWEDLEKQLPAYIKKSGSMMILPWKSDNGKWQWVNLEYFFPWGNYLAIARDMRAADLGEGIRDMGISNPFLSMLYTGLSAREDQPPLHSYFGTPIYNQLDPAWMKAAKLLEYMGNIWIPSMATRQGAIGYAGRAIAGGEDRWGREVSAGQALGRWFGINIVSVSPEQTRAQASVRIQDLRKEQSRIEANPSYDEEEKQAYAKRLNEKLAVIAREAPAAVLPITKAKGKDRVYEAMQEMAAQGILRTAPPSRSVEIAGTPFKMTMEQYGRYLEKTSEIARKRLLPLVDSAQWETMSDKRKSDAVSRIVASARKGIRQRIKIEIVRENREKIREGKIAR